MLKRAVLILWLVFFSANCLAGSQSPEIIKSDVVTVSVQQQFESVQPSGDSGLAIRFKLDDGWYFYALAKTAPGGMNLKIKPAAEKQIKFSEPIFPRAELYYDKISETKLEVFGGEFMVYLPFSVDNLILKQDQIVTADINIVIEGAVCSGMQCRMPDFEAIPVQIKISNEAAMDSAVFELPENAAKSGSADANVDYSVWFALGLAFVAGFSLNIMPCVWPVLPIIVMRIVGQAKQSKGKSISLGISFCIGILLFFAVLAITNIILQVFYGTALQWGDQFRNPAVVMAMGLLLIVLALFMFDVFAVIIPSSLASKSAGGNGFTGSVGMGFLAAVLSTPCSFGILAAAFAWAQLQPLALGTLAIMVIGIGMAVPYAVLVSMPGLLKRLPAAGGWMDIFKKTIGFLLLIIAVKLLTALPEQKIAGVLYFAVILSFAVWMWGGWVSYNTRTLRKWLIRIIAVAIVILSGRVFLTEPAGDIIDWQDYSSELIDTSISQGRAVLIKFSADWCMSCKVSERAVYRHKDIAELIAQKGVLAIKADTTEKDFPATKALKNIYNEPGVPVSILLKPDGSEPVKWRGLFFADELRNQLRKLPDK